MMQQRKTCLLCDAPFKYLRATSHDPQLQTSRQLRREIGEFVIFSTAYDQFDTCISA